MLCAMRMLVALSSPRPRSCRHGGPNRCACGRATAADDLRVAHIAASGCLIGYGPDPVELRVRTADFVGRLLAGANPAEMPFGRRRISRWASTRGSPLRLASSFSSRTLRAVAG